MCRHTSLEDPSYTQRRLLTEWYRHCEQSSHIRWDIYVGEAFYWDYNNSLLALQLFSPVKEEDQELYSTQLSIHIRSCSVPKVYNRKDLDYPEDAVYVGRPTKWGNPYVIGRDGSRDYVIQKYRGWLSAQLRNGYLNLAEIAGKDLVCWCAPLPCHADVLLEAIGEHGLETTADAPEVVEDDAPETD